MARLRFITGAIKGRLGEFVGSSWKGINYIKTFTAPSNPKTPLQVKVRSVFKALSYFATALYGQGFLQYIPSARRVTERNSVFKANQQMFRDKLFAPATLQVATANLQVVQDQISCKYSATDGMFTSKAIVAPSITTGLAYKIHIIVYDFVKGLALLSFSQNITLSPSGSFSFQSAGFAPLDFNTSTGSQIGDCRLYLFMSALDADNNKLISQTFSSPVTV